MTGPLARFGLESAKALSLWAEHAADLPAPWNGVELGVLDAAEDAGTAMREVEAHPDVIFGPYGSSPTIAAARATDRVLWNHGGATSASRNAGARRAPPRPPVKRTTCDSEAGMGPFSYAGHAV